ncbi:MAG: SAM-dependent methyltransferase, partial [Bacteroidota bacterium]
MKRSDAPELMDDLTADGPVVDQTLRELDFINKWLGGNQLSSQALLKLWPEDEHETELTLLDLGCGSGDIIRRMQDRIIKLGGRLMATGLDANPHIVALADGYAGK